MEPLRILVETSSNSISWFNVIQFILTVLIAIVTAWIAFNQYQVNRNRLKTELYEKRFQVFKLVDSLLYDIFTEGYVTHVQSKEFYIKTSSSKFLFDKEIEEFIRELYDKSINLYRLHLKLYPADGSPGLPHGDKRNEICQQEGELEKWFHKQNERSVNLFSKYLRIK